MLTPAPTTAPAIGQYLGADFTGWRILAQTPGDERLDPWSRARLADLAAVEATWAAHAAGTTLLHADIRADNVLLTGSGVVVVVDWPHACRGAAWVDVVLLAPSVAMQGGPSRPTCSPGRARDVRPAAQTWLRPCARWPATSPNAPSGGPRPDCQRSAHSRPHKARSPAAGWRNSCNKIQSWRMTAMRNGRPGRAVAIAA